MIREGHTEIVVPDLPRLNERNMLAVEIWNLTNSIESLTVQDAMTILGIPITQAKLYSVSLKIVHITGMSRKFERQEAEKRMRQVEAEANMARARTSTRR